MVEQVHLEFKRLAAEAEKRQREEAMREDAAAEEKQQQRGTRRPRRTPNRPGRAAHAPASGPRRLMGRRFAV